MVCALTSDGDILLKTEYRYAIGADVIECPAGMFDEGEKDPFVVTKRDLLDKKDAQRKQELLKTVENSPRTYDEIMAFLKAEE